MAGGEPSDRLSAYPYVVVRIRCDHCGRKGQYRLARLAAKYGPEASLAVVLASLTADCPWRSERRKGKSHYPEERCNAYLPDLIGPPRPPDTPPSPGKLTVIPGGKVAASGR